LTSEVPRYSLAQGAHQRSPHSASCNSREPAQSYRAVSAAQVIQRPRRYLQTQLSYGLEQ